MLDRYRRFLDSMEPSRRMQKENQEHTERSAREYLAKIANFTQLKEFIGSALTEGIDITAPDYDRESLKLVLLEKFTDLQDSFSSAILFSLGVLTIAQRPSVAASVQDAAWLLAGQVIGEYIAFSEPSEKCSVVYHRRDYHPPLLYQQTLAQSFFHTLSRNNEKKLSWLRFLEDYARGCSGDFIKDLMPPSSIDESQVSSLQASWKANSDPWAIIENHEYSFHISSYGYLPSFLKLFYCLDRIAWLQAMEALPLPQLIERTVDTALHDSDDSSFLTLLRNAPVMFSEEQIWTKNCTILLITRAIVSRLSSIHSQLLQLSTWSFDSDLSAEAKSRLSELERTGSHEWLNAAYSALMDRTDGRHIALFLMKCYVSQSGSQYFAHSESNWNVECVAAQVLAAHLTNHQLSTEGLLYRWLNNEIMAQAKASSSAAASTLTDDDWIGEGSKNLRTTGTQDLLVASKIWSIRYQSSGPSSSSKATEAWWLWRWLETLLYGYDKQVSTLVQYDCLETNDTALLAEVLLSCESPMNEWLISFRHLENQRHRLRRRTASLYWSCKPSIILNAIALLALRLMMERRESEDLGQTDLPDFMDRLFSATWFLYLTESTEISHSRDQLRLILSNCIVYFSLLGPDSALLGVKRMWELVGTEREIVCMVKELLSKIVENNISQRDAIVGKLRVVGIEFT